MSRRQLPEIPAKQTIRVPFKFNDIRGEKRADGVNSVRVEGYATVFDYEYKVYGGPPYGWFERVAVGAADLTLSEAPDVVYLLNHEGMALARTKSGTLELSADKRGMPTNASLDLANPTSRGLVSGIERGDIDEMSFAFRTTGQTWEAHPDFEDDDQSLRIITEFNIHRGDVSAVNFGASDATNVDLIRSLEGLNDEELDEARAVIERRLKLPGGTPGEDECGGMPLHLLEMLRIPSNPLLEQYS